MSECFGKTLKKHMSIQFLISSFFFSLFPVFKHKQCVHILLYQQKAQQLLQSNVHMYVGESRRVEVSSKSKQQNKKKNVDELFYIYGIYLAGIFYIILWIQLHIFLLVVAVCLINTTNNVRNMIIKYAGIM